MMFTYSHWPEAWMWNSLNTIVLSSTSVSAERRVKTWPAVPSLLNHERGARVRPVSIRLNMFKAAKNATSMSADLSNVTVKQ